MKKILVCLPFVVVAVFANPIDPRVLPLISEVLVQSPTQWYIELDMSQGGLGARACTTSAFRLHIASLKKTYDLKLYVENGGIAVITPASLLPASQMEQKTLAPFDTITISDTANLRTWKFPVRPVLAGFSLYNETRVSTPGDCPNPLSTDRISIGLRGNPPFIYTNPFISEVSIPDGSHWVIELDSRQMGRSLATALPCTLSYFRLQLSNSSIPYPVKAFFDTNGIALLRPGEMVSGSSVLVDLSFPVRINLLDSGWNSTLHKGLYWQFSINAPVDSRYTLINGGSVQTARTSIGTRTTYSTQHELYFVNSAMNPVYDVYMYLPVVKTFYLLPGYIPYTRVCMSLAKREVGAMTVIGIDIGKGYQKYGLCRTPLPADSCVTEEAFIGVQWEGRYLDEEVVKIDTIVMPDEVKVVDGKNSPPAGSQRFFSFQRSRQQILFTVGFSEKVARAQIAVYSLDGRLITMLPIGPVAVAGTYTCEWRHQRSVSPGMYVGALLIDGAEVQSQKIGVW
ncbi:MAG: hypothetical protein JXA71_13940 [Chitinispirillaceae bacterium]|nr:hypothetical protein [Chitinispirillaceae bacterium]